MAAPTFDLQSHSRHSDGALAPAEVVAEAARAGVELLALSDHDNVDGVAEALEAGAREGVRVAPAVEITAIDGDHADLHVLGYLIDHTDARLLERLAGYRAQREGRADRIVEACRELGLEVDDSVLEARAAQGKSIGRPHIAQAVFGHPANAERMAAEGHGDFTSFLVAYLIEGAPAFVAREGPSVAEAITTVHEAGGLAVWAHPFWDIAGPEEVLEHVERFRGEGLDGVECFYATHTREQTELLADRCEALGLLTTGSADYHGPEHRQFRAFRTFETYGREPRLGPIAEV
ncbi:MAG TPA: PHP domain-containing protein [Solirubrobacteraceae bacterium]|nr:PHP domain-containing protein [Solirubrobacteraceae bacterium]